jgi:hypothetical protein
MTVAETAPTIIKALRDQLGNCASWTTAGGSAARVHYPRVDPDNATFPCAVLEKISGTSYRAFTGVSLKSGTLAIHLFMEYSGSISTIEELADDLQTEICQDTGIEGLRCVGVTEAEEPTPEGDQVVVVTIELEYGLEVSA